MKHRLLFIFLLFFTLTHSQTQSFAGNWAKVEYIDCLNDSLPYECFIYKYPPFLTFRLDSIDSLYFGRERIINYKSTPNNISFDVLNSMKSFIEKKRV